MKRLFRLLLALTILLSLCGCQGNFGSVDLQSPLAIPDDGLIGEEILQQIKDENAVAVFKGESGGMPYEWTVFGSDIAAVQAVDLQVQLRRTGEGHMAVTLGRQEPFGFSALLSVHLGERWAAQSATAYAGDTAVAAVSLTGSETTIVNLTLDGSVAELVISPDPVPEDGGADSDTANDTADTGNDAVSTPDSGGEEVQKDQYLTDPVPEGKPAPVEPQEQEVDTRNTYTCTFSIECATILNNLAMLEPEKLEMVPSGGVILPAITVTFYEGESVFNVLQRVCIDNGIHMESEFTPIYNSAYVEGIHNLYEFDCGALSGWMYRVNGWYPNYGCSRYQLQQGDLVEWRYTCDLGNDVGGAYAVGGQHE